MTRREVQTVTALPRSPDEDRRRRMVQYTVAMSIRTVCVVAAVVVPDWWRLIPALGAVVLPYIAVVIANVSSPGATDHMESPVHNARPPGRGDPRP